MPINQLIFLFKTGTVIYTKRISQNLPDENFLSPFISAIITFAQRSFNTSDLSYIQIGKNMITVEQGFLGDMANSDENEDLEILGIMLSTGIDDSTAKALLSHLIEVFTVNLDQIIQEQTFSYQSIRVGQLPDMKLIDDKLDQIINRQNGRDFHNYDLSFSIPNKTLELIHKLFNENPDIGEIYAFKESALMEQMLIEYINYDLEEKLKEKFRLKTDFY